MLPSSTASSSSQGGLMRYGSAPSSVLTNAVDSVNRELSSAFAPQTQIEEPAISLQRSNYGLITNTCSSSSSSSLIRHSSSPPGFLNDYLPTAATDHTGFSMTRGIGSSYNSKGIADNGHSVSRLNSQLSFTHTKEALSRISEETENIADGDTADNGKKRLSHSNINSSDFFTMGLWDDNNPTFSVSPTKQPKTINTNGPHDTMESQFQFGMPQAALELATMDMLLNIPQDSVPCKIRAKRGCATHPRSIAERERRTRISGKLKKLQDLVPNMDKQTSYADMLDLAVQHIKSLQNQAQKLNNEIDCCTCGCKKTTTS